MYNYPHKNYRPFSAICDCGLVGNHLHKATTDHMEKYRR